MFNIIFHDKSFINSKLWCCISSIFIASIDLFVLYGVLFQSFNVKTIRSQEQSIVLFNIRCSISAIYYAILIMFICMVPCFSHLNCRTYSYRQEHSLILLINGVLFWLYILQVMILFIYGVFITTIFNDMRFMYGVLFRPSVE